MTEEEQRLVERIANMWTFDHVLECIRVMDNTLGDSTIPQPTFTVWVNPTIVDVFKDLAWEAHHIGAMEIRNSMSYGDEYAEYQAYNILQAATRCYW